MWVIFDEKLILNSRSSNEASYCDKIHILMSLFSLSDTIEDALAVTKYRHILNLPSFLSAVYCKNNGTVQGVTHWE